MGVWLLVRLVCGLSQTLFDPCSISTLRYFIKISRKELLCSGKFDSAVRDILRLPSLNSFTRFTIDFVVLQIEALKLSLALDEVQNLARRLGVSKPLWITSENQVA